MNKLLLDSEKSVSDIDTATVYVSGPCEFVIKQAVRNLERYGITRIVRPSHHFDEETFKDLLLHFGSLRSEQNDFKSAIKLIRPLPEGRSLSGDSSSELPYHVDGPQDIKQPDLLAFMYGRPATSGGTSRFVDARLIIDKFINDYGLTALLPLANRNSVAYTKGDKKILGHILNIDTNNNLALRVRLHEAGLTFHREDTYDAWKKLVKISEEVSQLIFLPNPGDIVIFDNKRFLHARDLLTVSNGERYHYRAWIDVKPTFKPIKTGISVSNDLNYLIAHRNRGHFAG